MDVLGEASAVLEGKLALVIAEHGVGKRRGDGDNHPPDQTSNKVLAFTANKGRHQAAIELGDVQGDQGPQDQEYAVADEKA